MGLNVCTVLTGQLTHTLHQGPAAGWSKPRGKGIEQPSVGCPVPPSAHILACQERFRRVLQEEIGSVLIHHDLPDDHPDPCLFRPLKGHVGTVLPDRAIDGSGSHTMGKERAEEKGTQHVGSLRSECPLCGKDISLEPLQQLFAIQCNCSILRWVGVGIDKTGQDQAIRAVNQGGTRVLLFYLMIFPDFEKSAAFVYDYSSVQKECVPIVCCWIQNMPAK